MGKLRRAIALSLPLGPPMLTMYHLATQDRRAGRVQDRE